MPRKNFHKTPFALAIAAAFQILPSHASSPDGNEFLVNTFITNSQATPAIARDGSGNYVVVWSSSGQDGSSYGIYARRYSAAGVAQGGEFKVNTFTNNAQQHPAVAMDSAGDFVVAWESGAQDGSQYGIFAQRYNASGAAQSSEFQVNTHTGNTQQRPVVAMDTAGDFVIAWQSSGQDGSVLGIYAQRFNAIGAALGTEFKVNGRTSNTQAAPAIAMDSAGEFVVCWHSYLIDGSTYEIYAQRYASTGDPFGTEFKVNTSTASDQKNPAVAMAANGDFVVAWDSYSQDGALYGIYAKRFDAAGATQGSEFRINTTVTDSQVDSAVGMGAGGNFVVTWSSRNQDGAGYGIYAQRYTAVGVAQGSEFKVNTFTTGGQTSSAVTLDAVGNFVVVWQSTGQDSDGDGIYAQRFSKDDNLTTMLSAMAGGQSYSSTPGSPDFLAGGTFSFNANYCNTSANTLTGLYSQITVLANNNQQENRTRDSASGNGGAGAQMDIAATNGYSDLQLTNGECVSVPYVIGLTARSPFQFRVNIKGSSN